MLASAVITKVQRQLVETAGVFWSPAELLSLYNDGEADLNDRVRILQGKYSTDLLLGITEYPLPDNWLAEKAIFVNTPSITPPFTPAWTRLMPSSLEKQAQQNANFLSNESNTFGAPLQFFIWQNAITVVPTPSVTVGSGMVMFYDAKPIPLTGSAQNANLDDVFKDALVQYMLWFAWDKEKEVTLSQKAALAYEAQVRKALSWKKKRQADQRNMIDIDSPVPFSLSGQFFQGFNPF
jgi:hypothetical protein